MLESQKKETSTITGVSLIPQLDKRLMELCKKTKKPKSYFLREAFMRCLNEFENEVSPQVSYK